MNKKMLILRRLPPFLCNKRINNGVMQPVSRQRIGKHVPAATNTHITIELLLKRVFSVRSVHSGYNDDNWGDPVERWVSAWEAVTVGPESGKLKILHCWKPLLWNGWWRHSRLEKGLAGAVVICGWAVITCSSELCIQFINSR
jgi:hypothetical protein